MTTAIWTIEPWTPKNVPKRTEAFMIYVASRFRWDFVGWAPTSSKIHPSPRGVCFWINCLIGTVFFVICFKRKNNININTSTQNNARHVQYQTTKFVEQQRTNQTETCQKHVNQRNKLKPPGSGNQENKHPQNLDLELLTFKTPFRLQQKIDILIRVQKCIKVGVVSYWGPGGPTKQLIIRQIVSEIWCPKKIKVWFPYKNEPLV